MATLYTMRYVCGSDSDAAVRQYVAEHGVHFIVLHDAGKSEKAHWHALFRSDKKRDALANHMKRNCKISGGNETYSLKKVDDEKIFERYMCHGAARGDIVHVVGAQPPADEPTKYGEQWCAERNAEFYDEQRKFVENIKKKKKESVSVIDETLARCVAKSKTQRDEIVDELIEVYGERRAPMNTFQMRAQTNTIYFLRNKKHAKEDIKQAILERI